MDRLEFSSRGVELIRKYRYVILVIVIGVLLLTIPESSADEPDMTDQHIIPQDQRPLEESLSRILSLIEGAGKVEVLLTQERGEEILYQTDEDQSSASQSQDIRRDTVLISGNDRTQTGLIRQTNPPVYQGALILCQGADNAGVRLSIVEAVMDVTGLTSDRITVLKMK